MTPFERLKRIFFTCGVDSDQYWSIVPQAFAGNFRTWRILNIFFAFFFVAMIIVTLAMPDYPADMSVYVVGSAFSIFSCVGFFFFFKEDKLFPQILIYLEIFVLIYLGYLLSLSQKNMMAVSFIVLLLIIPMTIVGRPAIMSTVIIVAAAIHIYISVNYKLPITHQGDVLNTIIFSVISVVLLCIHDCQRVNEFLLHKQVETERDTDNLTGLKSKTALVRLINDSLGTSDVDLVMFAMDVDKFKSINDNYGHPEGDKVLMQIGKAITTVIGDSGDDAVCGRFGGDEFVVLLRDVSIEEASDKAAELISYVNRNVHTPKRDEVVSISLGLAETVGDEHEYDDLFRKADTALYESKKNGRNRYTVYEEQMV